MRTRIYLFLILLSLVMTLPVVGLAGEETVVSIPVEDYARYDQIITSKFLHSETQLVLLERKTTTQISPEQDGLLTSVWFLKQAYFDGTLPVELARGFVAVNQAPARVEGRFQFGTRYRFVSGNAVEEPEVSLARPVLAGWLRSVQAMPVLDRLVFSRIGYNLRQTDALVYVGNPRPDGSGAGFLVWLRRQGSAWSIWDTEVLWTVRIEPESDGGPLLAP
ncbi:conserved exported hypothetical protein [Nitrospira lenta]|uniref:Uncharacterized protein n=2 Tax=Nitrospira lenta TaxID=1436998 RepID=A0A330LAD0_9BACT|nr:conserved exported hypothetical protein [Nitrospira lenta]